MNGVLPFFGSVDWYREVVSSGECLINGQDVYRRQTPRNRCDIVGANGVQTLTVPVTMPETAKSGRCPMREVLISDHGNWRHVHWQTLASAYGMSPFFDFYADDIRPFFEERKWKYLFDYNLDITRTMLQLLGAENVDLRVVDKSSTSSSHFDNRSLQSSPQDSPHSSLHSSQFVYYQTFQRRHGFIPGMSILDLLFNEGPEAILKLEVEG